MKNLFVLSAIVMATFTYAGAQADGQYSFDQGVHWLSKKCEGAVGEFADPKPIEKAIAHFKAAMQDIKLEREAAEKLLYSLNFKGSFVRLSEDEKKRIYEEGKNLGSNMVKKYPNDAGIKFWYMANLGEWGILLGKLEAARNGITTEVKKLCEDVIRLAPAYNDAGAYRVLGAMHYKLPYIPFLLPWPSDETALELLEKAYTISPCPANTYHYGMVLEEMGHDEKAVKVMNELLSREPRPGFEVEDRAIFSKTREALADW